MNNVVLASGHSKGVQSAVYMCLFFFQIIFPFGLFQSLFDIPLCSLTALPPVSLLSEQTLVLGPTLAPHGGRPQGTWPWAPGRGGRPTWHSRPWHLGAAWLRCLWAGVFVRLECWPGTSTEGGGRRAAAAESPGL